MSETENAMPGAVIIKANIAARLNVAFHQNSVPAIAEIELVNDTENDLNGISISVSAVPGFLQPKTFRFDQVLAGGTQRLNPVPIDFDAKYLLGLSEAVRGEIDLVARVGETEVARLTTSCQLLSPSEWTGLSTAPELIAAFVRPNDASVDIVLRNAAEKLRKAHATRHSTVTGRVRRRGHGSSRKQFGRRYAMNGLSMRYRLKALSAMARKSARRPQCWTARSALA